jgi:adenine-specific DNA-methyltransferase
MPTLDFKGKHYVYAHHLSVPFRTLSVDVEKSLSDAPNLDDNLIIHGDNLHGLKALLPQYAGKIKCIYIDPPYNTGNEGWCYNDKVNSPLIREWLKKEANPVDKEDMERHDKWLCMMWPRLTLLRELLADDGVIFISIDDNEHHHLRAMMDEIFGQENFLASFLWKKKGTSTNVEGAFISPNADYQLCYRKTYSGFLNQRIKLKEERQYPQKDSLGNYRTVGIEKKNSGSYKRETMQFEILGQTPRMGKRWQIGKDTAEKLESIGRLIIESGIVKRKIYDFEDKDTTSANPTYLPDNCGSTDSAAKNLNDIFQIECDFENPKPHEMIKHLVGLKDKNAIILDSFAGSGTTAHAVLALNQEDGGNRKFILIECEDYADTITAERVRRVIRGVPTAKDAALKNGLGGSFTYCTLGGEMDIENILSGEHLPDYNALSQYVFYTATGRSLPRTITPQPDFFVGETDVYAVYVIYRPDLGYLRSNQSALNDEKVDIIQAHPSQKKKLVFATAKFMSGEELKDRNITFCQIPYAIHNFVGV